jgi:hypothetical protein
MAKFTKDFREGNLEGIQVFLEEINKKIEENSYNISFKKQIKLEMKNMMKESLLCGQIEAFKFCLRAYDSYLIFREDIKDIILSLRWLTIKKEEQVVKFLLKAGYGEILEVRPQYDYLAPLVKLFSLCYPMSDHDGSWARKKNEEIVEAFTEKPFLLDLIGEDLLFKWCIRLQYIQFITIVLDRGISINAKREDGMTPLHLIMQFGASTKMVLDFLERGADVHARALDGRRPIDCIWEYRDNAEEIRSILKTAESWSLAKKSWCGAVVRAIRSRDVLPVVEPVVEAVAEAAGLPELAVAGGSSGVVPSNELKSEDRTPEGFKRS